MVSSFNLIDEFTSASCEIDKCSQLKMVVLKPYTLLIYIDRSDFLPPLWQSTLQLDSYLLNLSPRQVLGKKLNLKMWITWRSSMGKQQQKNFKERWEESQLFSPKQTVCKYCPQRIITKRSRQVYCSLESSTWGNEFKWQWQRFRSHSRELADYEDWLVIAGIYGISFLRDI